MAQVTIYKEPGIVVEVIDGDAPVDQSAEVAALTAERDAAVAALAALQASFEALQAKVLAANSAIDAAQTLLS